MYQPVICTNLSLLSYIFGIQVFQLHGDQMTPHTMTSHSQSALLLLNLCTLGGRDVSLLLSPPVPNDSESCLATPQAFLLLHIQSKVFLWKLIFFFLYWYDNSGFLRGVWSWKPRPSQRHCCSVLVEMFLRSCEFIPMSSCAVTYGSLFAWWRILMIFLDQWCNLQGLLSSGGVFFALHCTEVICW